MKLQDEDIALNDRVYDISSDRGYGNVIKIGSRSFEVRFGRGRTITYNGKGVQKNKEQPTLFWDKPYIMAPTKDSNHWVNKKEVLEGLFKLINESKAYL